MTDEPAGVVLAATVHDPGGDFASGLERTLDPLRALFLNFVMQVTSETHPTVVRLLRDGLGAVVEQARADGQIGLHRRNALALALPTRSHLLYSDLDHLLRWIEADRPELERVLGLAASKDMVIVGRTPTAMAACPQRLRDTEAIINHIVELMTGHSWDLMFAIRLMSPEMAASIVEHCVENTIGNDVEWPLHALTNNFTVGYADAAGLSYRIASDFDTPTDEHDLDPGRWIDRIDIANQQAQAMRRYLPSE
ncbi:MAG: hypothetical protein QOH68_3961 [Nocardioidaceae bacterium]|nr:hypothetical protein [Nocardioidaceae bacterium]